MSFIEKIFGYSKADEHLAKLLVRAAEYAEIYLLAKRRQKGCDGMGELATMKEEFRDIVDKVIQYSQERRYISEVISCDIDLVADEIVKVKDTL